MIRRKVIALLVMLHAYLTQVSEKYPEAKQAEKQCLFLLSAVSETLPQNLRMTFSSQIRRDFNRVPKSDIMTDELFIACIIDMIAKLKQVCYDSDNDRLKAVGSAVDSIYNAVVDCVEPDYSDIEKASSIVDEYFKKLKI